MCGRFSNTLTWLEIVELLSLAENHPPMSIEKNTNISPKQNIAFSCINEHGNRIVTHGLWSLVPSWIKEIPQYPTFNARSETAAEKPTFRGSFRHKRCLIPANGYYEWEKLKNNKKQPWFIHLESNAPFCFAGLWDYNDYFGTVSCTILTTHSVPHIAHIHGRMPIILSPFVFSDWLNPATKTEEVKKILGTNENNSLLFSEADKSIFLKKTPKGPDLLNL